MTEADRARIVIWQRVKVRRATAESFRSRQHLRVDFQADNWFVFFEIYAIRVQGLSNLPLANRVQILFVPPSLLAFIISGKLVPVCSAHLCFMNGAVSSLFLAGSLRQHKKNSAFVFGSKFLLISFHLSYFIFHTSSFNFSPGGCPLKQVLI